MLNGCYNDIFVVIYFYSLLAIIEMSILKNFLRVFHRCVHRWMFSWSTCLSRWSTEHLCLTCLTQHFAYPLWKSYFVYWLWTSLHWFFSEYDARWNENWREQFEIWKIFTKQSTQFSSQTTQDIKMRSINVFRHQNDVI